MALRKLHVVRKTNPESSSEAAQRLARQRVRARRRKLSPFLLVVAGWTVLSHGCVALAAFAAARAADLWQPALLATLLALAAVLPLRRRIMALMPDRPRSSWRIHLLEEPYFAHWCAASLAMFVTTVAALAWGPARLIAGHAPFSVPNAAAWGYAVGLALAAWGVWVRRNWVRVRHVPISIQGLDPAFHGYKIVQLSDLHVGSFTPEALSAAWVRMANAVHADLITITGDLVTNGSAFHARVAELVGGLRARDGVVVSPGNHDYFGDAHDLFDRFRMKRARVLRNDAFVVHRSGASLTIAGVDDTWTRQADVRAALTKRAPGAPVVLLAHDPDLFPDAVRAGVQLVLSGHTHGGQVAVPMLARWLNLSRLSHSYHLGLYHEGVSHLYVNPGLGTTGPPIRLGTAPEITVLILQAGPAA